MVKQPRLSFDQFRKPAIMFGTDALQTVTTQAEKYSPDPHA
jgi:hypothetical protein